MGSATTMKPTPEAGARPGEAAAPAMGPGGGARAGLAQQLKTAGSYAEGAEIVKPVQQKAKGGAVQKRDDTAAASEVTRLTQEITRLAQKNAWTGVERTYGQLVSYGLPIDPGVHLTAAEAARSAGNMSGYRERLELGRAADPAQVEAALSSIDASYGTLHVTSKKRDQVQVAWAGPPPFQPDLAAAIATAVDTANASGNFHGLVPAGAYTINGETVEVQAGGTASWSPAKGKKKEKEAAPEAPAAAPAAAAAGPDRRTQKLYEEMDGAIEYGSLEAIQYGYKQLQDAGVEIPQEYTDALRRAEAGGQ